MPSIEVLANTKTVEAFKATEYDGFAQKNKNRRSDAKVFADGLKKYDSAYSKVYEEGSKVTNSDFWNKSRRIKYWARHGTDRGRLYGNGNCKANVDIYSKKNFSWSGSNLEFVFLATCNQLTKEGSNPAKKYAKAMRGDKAVRVICGYHDTAPSIGDDYVAEQFIKFAKTGESVKSSWIKANEYVYNKMKLTGCSHYAVLTHSGSSQYSRLPGMPGKKYARPGKDSKKIIRFRKGVDGNEVIVKSSKNAKSTSEVPEYKLKATNVKFNAKKKCDDVIFKDGYTLATDVGEIKNKEVDFKKSKLINLTKNYIKDNIESNYNIDIENENIVIEPITMSGVDDAIGSEVTIAYNVRVEGEYEGIPIDDNKYSVIIDSEGVKFSYLNWNKMQKKKSNNVVENYSEAVDKLNTDGIDSNKNSILVRTAKSGKSCESEIKDSEVKFVYNEETGYYEPNYEFTLSDESVVDVNCCNGDVNIVEESVK